MAVKTKREREGGRWTVVLIAVHRSRVSSEPKLMVWLVPRRMIQPAVAFSTSGYRRFICTIHWEFATSLFKIHRKNSRILRTFLKFVKKIVQIPLITPLVTAKSSNSHNTKSYNCWEQFICSRLHWGKTVEWEQWAVEASDFDTGEDTEAAGDSYTL